MYLPLHEGHEHSSTTGDLELVVVALVVLVLLGVTAYVLRARR